VGSSGLPDRAFDAGSERDAELGDVDFDTFLAKALMVS
jgi:hypothetical protein